MREEFFPEEGQGGARLPRVSLGALMILCLGGVLGTALALDTETMRANKISRQLDAIAAVRPDEATLRTTLNRVNCTRSMRLGGRPHTGISIGPGPSQIEWAISNVRNMLGRAPAFRRPRMVGEFQFRDGAFQQYTNLITGERITSSTASAP